MTAPTRNPFKRKRRLPSPEEVAVWIVLLIGAFTIGLGIGLPSRYTMLVVYSMTP
jgi:hypothetical protein